MHFDSCFTLVAFFFFLVRSFIASHASHVNTGFVIELLDVGLEMVLKYN